MVMSESYCRELDITLQNRPYDFWKNRTSGDGIFCTLILNGPRWYDWRTLGLEDTKIPQSILRVRYSFSIPRTRTCISALRLSGFIPSNNKKFRATPFSLLSIWLIAAKLSSCSRRVDITWNSSAWSCPIYRQSSWRVLCVLINASLVASIIRRVRMFKRNGVLLTNIVYTLIVCCYCTCSTNDGSHVWDLHCLIVASLLRLSAQVFPLLFNIGITFLLF